jgi:hypothetical protein
VKIKPLQRIVERWFKFSEHIKDDPLLNDDATDGTIYRSLQEMYGDSCCFCVGPTELNLCKKDTVGAVRFTNRYSPKGRRHWHPLCQEHWDYLKGLEQCNYENKKTEIIMEADNDDKRSKDALQPNAGAGECAVNA